MAIAITDLVVDEADAYFATRLNSEAWINSGEADKIAGLTTAANMFNAMEWVGRPATLTAAFPRYIDSKVAVTPLRIKWALFEQAIHLLNNPSLLFEEDTVNSIVLGPIELKELSNAPLIPKYVKVLIAPFTSSNGSLRGGGIWWRAN